MSHNNNAVMRLVTPYMDPRTLARVAATSRNARAMASPRQKEFALIRRLVRRRAAIKKHFENRRPATATRRGSKGRIASPLYTNRIEAIRRIKVIRKANNSENANAKANAKATVLAMKLRRLRQAASQAYLNYQRAGTNAAWNRFVLIHRKTLKPGQPNITRTEARNAARVTARRMYN
jgi:hypothetical protein